MYANDLLMNTVPVTIIAIGIALANELKATKKSRQHGSLQRSRLPTLNRAIPITHR